MHLRSVAFRSETYPTRDCYPFNLSVIQQTKRIVFDAEVTLFVGENGTGKSTLLEAISQTCNIFIWRDSERARFECNPYEDKFHQYLVLEWTNGFVPGSFFGSDIFRQFAQILDEWAASDPGQLRYFGGKSLMTQSHGQSLMSYFKSRYQIKGLYLLDEPETALSPRSQIELLEVLTKMSNAGHAQFIIATHSPILLACPGAMIYSFDHSPVKRLQYEETAHYRIYKGFMEDRRAYLK
jgi:predicted ATPase